MGIIQASPCLVNSIINNYLDFSISINMALAADRTKDEIIEAIKWVLKDKVAPAVAQHGGFVNYMDFDMELGVAKLEIVGEDDVKAEEKGYTPFVPRNEPVGGYEEEQRLQKLIDEEYKRT